MSGERIAALWHWADLALAAALVLFAGLGLAGHYWLRRRMWHESKRQEA